MEPEAQSTKSEEVKVQEESLVEQMIEDEVGLKPTDEGYPTARKGVEFFFRRLLAPEMEKRRVDSALVTDLIAEIDKRVSTQVDEILHHPDLQRMESAWRGLNLLVDRTDFRENIEIEYLNVSKDDLLADFKEAPEVTKSGLYKIVYSAEYGQFGGKPFAAMIGNYEFDPSSPDIELLQYVASVGTMAHAPFIAAASPKFFFRENDKDYDHSFRRLPNLKDLKQVIKDGGPRYTKWNSFRGSEDSRSVALTLPRFLLRLPYSQKDNPVGSFGYDENVTGSHNHYLWGNTAFAFATRLADSFAKDRWCANIIGPAGGGAVEDLPIHHFESMGTIRAKVPTEVLITDRRELELADEGFIALAMRKDSDNACFFSANSCQRAKTFGQSDEGKQAELNFRLGLQLPYMFVVTRIAHYLKVLQREQLGSYKERADLESELQNWIKQYIADYEAQPAVRKRRPLRKAEITVSDVAGDPGWYRVEVKIRPHFKYMGAFFTLSLVGRLDKK